jgi:prevent-host-death family protein
MRTIGALEAKTRFGELLAEVAAGAVIEITEHGMPVARLVPAHQDTSDAATVIEEWERYRDEHNVVLGGGITIRELIEEGRE